MHIHVCCIQLSNLVLKESNHFLETNREEKSWKDNLDWYSYEEDNFEKLIFWVRLPTLAQRRTAANIVYKCQQTESSMKPKTNDQRLS